MYRTHSQLVDALVAETLRRDMKVTIGNYVNQTIRELHARTDTAGEKPVLFAQNLIETTIEAEGESNYVWEIPDYTNFQLMLTARYDDVVDRDSKPVYPHFRRPGRHLNNEEFYYYRSGMGFAFAGYGGDGCSISLAYYTYPRDLKYFESAARPASYDNDAGWSYLDAATETEKLAARERVTNWILMSWPHLVAEGTRAKLYKRLNDTERARTSYSLFEKSRQMFWAAEALESEGA